MPLVKLDAEHDIPALSDVCMECVHFDWSDVLARKCQAFRDGIPLPIWMGENNHTEPYPGDGGVQFEFAKTDLGQNRPLSRQNRK